MPASFACKKWEVTGNGGSARAQFRLVAAIAPNSASAAVQRNAKLPSVLHRLIDQPLDHRLNLLAFRRRLLQQYEEHVFLAVNCEIAAAGAVPFQFAKRARRRRLGVAGIGAHPEAEPEAETVARKIEEVTADAGAGSDLIGSHLLIGLGAEIWLAGELAAIEYHLREASNIRHGRDQ